MIIHNKVCFHSDDVPQGVRGREDLVSVQADAMGK